MAAEEAHPAAMTLAGLLTLPSWPHEHAGERRLEWLWHFDLPVGPGV